MKDDSSLLVREQYLLRSTFFYNRLCAHGYFALFARVGRFVELEGERLDWSRRAEWHVSDSAWAAVAAIGINPALVFVHPKVLSLSMPFLRYYRSIALLPQKGLSALAQVHNVADLENGQVDAGNAKPGIVLGLTCAFIIGSFLLLRSCPALCVGVPWRAAVPLRASLSQGRMGNRVGGCALGMASVLFRCTPGWRK